jgi:hypothetical protein
MGRGWVSVGVLVLAIGCGGRSQSREADDGSALGEGDDDGEPKGNAGPDTAPGDEVSLPGCELGERDLGERGSDCLWLADGRCYQDKLEACACICPPGTGSVCSSGFEDPDNGRVPVYCN